MLRYILRRIILAVIALAVLMVLVFFLMQAIPGYSLQRQQNWTDAQYLERLGAEGLLANPVVQFGKFIEGLFHGQFGKVYNSSETVVEKFIQPMQYSMMISGPAFVLSSIIGVGLGIISAYYRGKWVDSLINLIAVLFVSIPSFIFALLLANLSGILGLPTQFDASGSAYKMFTSLIMPVLAMTLASISGVLYYTRNELVEVFKQDYIKTALSKGVSFKKIILTHALRNASIPIVAILLPSFVGVMSGSIIVERFFAIPGVSSVIVNAVQQKETYIVLFASLFYASLYFSLHIIADVLYTLIDPRIVISSKNNSSIIKTVKSLRLRNLNKQEILNNDYYLNNFNFNSINLGVEEKLIDNKVDLPTKKEISFARTQINTNIEFAKPTNVSYLKNNYFNEKLFIKSKNAGNNNEQIVGKPSNYWKDVFTRFCKSKTSVIFSILLIGIILFSIIVPLISPNSINESLGSGNFPGLVSYLPPRIPGLGITGIVAEKVVDNQTFHLLQELHAKYPGLYSSANEIGASWVVKDFNPYVLPGLKHSFPFMGTDGIGRNWWNMLWYATAKSLTLSVLASLGAVLIGAIYGAISGMFIGKWIDNIMMRIVEILNGVPLIIWVLILSMAISTGTTNIFTIAFALIVTTWMSAAIITRTYVLKIKDAEFVYAAQTLGASKVRILASHLLPNVLGRLAVVFVNNIPAIIFFESSLVFLGLSSSVDVSIGSMIDTAWKENLPYLLVGPTLMICLITLSSQLMANNLNDSIDPRIVN